MLHKPHAPVTEAGLIAAAAVPRCGAKRRKDGKPCQAPAMPNGRCRMHGGPSTGPKTPEGKAASRAAVWKHGKRSLAARAAATKRAEARRLAKELTEQYRAVLAKHRPQFFRG